LNVARLERVEVEHPVDRNLDGLVPELGVGVVVPAELDAAVGILPAEMRVFFVDHLFFLVRCA
jgi:hypothetical protein